MYQQLEQEQINLPTQPRARAHRLGTPTIAAGVLGHHHKLVATTAPQHAVDLVHVRKRPSRLGGDKKTNAGRLRAQDRPKPTNETKNIKKCRKSTKYVNSCKFI